MNGILIGFGLCCFILVVAAGVSTVVVLALANKKQWPQRSLPESDELLDVAQRVAWKLERDLNYFASFESVSIALMRLGEQDIERATMLGDAYLNDEMTHLELVKGIAVLFVEVE